VGGSRWRRAPPPGFWPLAGNGRREGGEQQQGPVAVQSASCAALASGSSEPEMSASGFRRRGAKNWEAGGAW